MTLLYSFISLGTSPDFKMTSGALELNHRAVFSVLKGSVITHHDGVYDRSLAQAMTKLKQKMAPYGWTPATEMKWTLATDINAQLETELGTVNATYRVLPALSQSQTDVIVTAINAFFKPISESPK
ncbi:MAG: hypothetical protein WCO71_13630 [Pseudomonadota bacterium]